MAIFLILTLMINQENCCKIVVVVKWTSLALQLQASVTNYMFVTNYFHYDLSDVITQNTYISHSKHILPSSVTAAVSLIITGQFFLSANLVFLAWIIKYIFHLTLHHYHSSLLSFSNQLTPLPNIITWRRQKLD